MDRKEGGLRTKGLFSKKLEKGKPLVSIVTPCLNSGKYLEQTIQSVINQTYNNIEYIIIDGRSIDRTLDIIEKYEDKIAYWISEPDEGMYDAINKGLKISKGEILAYINADDLYYDKNVIEKVVSTFNKNESCHWVYSNFDAINGNCNLINQYRVPKFNWTLFASIDWCYIPQPTTFWKREILKKCGLLNPKYKMAADYEFFLRIGKDYKSKKLLFKVAKFRFHREAQTQKNQETNIKEMNDIIELYDLKDIKFRKIYKVYITIIQKMINIDNYIQRLFYNVS